VLAHEDIEDALLFSVEEERKDGLGGEKGRQRVCVGVEKSG
jgi:hypothetical protein